MSKEKKINEPYHKFYKCLKPFGKLAFNIYYRPKVVNKHYIPKDGPIIVCGNHIHVLDQMMPVFSTKRMLHYMAKKEYFDSKFAWFFKASGCISVNRQIHDDDAKRKALEVLNNNLALGIFPEGTRNQVSCKKDRVEELYKLFENDYTKKEFIKILKKNMVRITQVDLLKKLESEEKITSREFKEYVLNSNKYLKELVTKEVITFEEYKDTLLMPFKFGTVSMAQKTNATIVPFVITGKYRFIGGKLKCTFLKPIEVLETDDLERVNILLRNEMLEALAKEN